MYQEQTVAVVVPAYNEAGFVGEVLDTIPDFVDRVYPVDDGSTDATWAEMQARAAAANDSEAADDQRVVPLRHEENAGVGASITTGYERAATDGVDVVAVMAGDGQMDPDLLSRLVDPVATGGVDYAKGDRLHDRTLRAGMSDWRLFGNVILTMLTKAASGYWTMMDPQNGYTAISGSALERLDLDAVFDDYGFANAMLVHCNVAGLRVADVPMPARYGEEESDIRYATFVPQVSALLAKGFCWRLARKHLLDDFHPFPLLYGVGALGTLAGCWQTVRGWLGSDRGEGPLTALVGLLAGLLAMAFDVTENDALHVTVEDEPGSHSGQADATRDGSEPAHDGGEPTGRVER